MCFQCLFSVFHTENYIENACDGETHTQTAPPKRKSNPPLRPCLPSILWVMQQPFSPLHAPFCLATQLSTGSMAERSIQPLEEVRMKIVFAEELNHILLGIRKSLGVVLDAANLPAQHNCDAGDLRFLGLVSLLFST
jgi:hypothetical protein